MDIAYDHIQEEVISPDEAAQQAGKEKKGDEPTLNEEFAQAYKAISSSPWGARFGAFVGTVKKQGESYYENAQKEYEAASSQASKGITDLTSTIINRTRSLSLNTPGQSSATSSTVLPNTHQDGSETTAGDAERTTNDTLSEYEGMLARLKVEASKRLEELAKAEDAADEALLKFGTNVRNFLRDAITITEPAEGSSGGEGLKLLFESKGGDGKRVIHTTRFDAQLHVIHSSLDSFTRDPASKEYAPWLETFNVESQTEEIAKDLDKYKELRSAMEKAVPDKVSYDEFWKRYYFLRHVIETEEQRRRELLKGANTTPDQEISWDADSDDEAPAPVPTSSASSTTLHPRTAPEATVHKPRRSNDQVSQPDSDASYDVVGATSGAPSHAPSSPREESKKAGDESDEDWE